MHALTAPSEHFICLLVIYELIGEVRHRHGVPFSN